MLYSTAKNVLAVRGSDLSGITLDTYSLAVSGEADVGTLKVAGNITSGNEVIMTAADNNGTLAPFFYARTGTEIDALNSAGDQVSFHANSVVTSGGASFGDNTIVRGGHLLEFQYPSWTSGAVPQLQATSANTLALRDTSGNGITLDTYGLNVGGTATVGGDATMLGNATVSGALTAGSLKTLGSAQIGNALEFLTPTTSDGQSIKLAAATSEMLELQTNAFTHGPLTMHADRFRETFHTPASSTEACTLGDFTDDTGYHYVCTATNTWKRVALSTF